MDGEDRRVAKSLMQYWQLWVLLLGGAIACVKFYYTVQDLSEAQKRWQQSAEVKREKSRDELEAIRIKIAVQEKEIEWLKKR